MAKASTKELSFERVTRNYNRRMFEVLGPIREIELIAASHSIRELSRLQKFYGPGRWRKLKGFATVKLSDGTIKQAEVHWYQAHGIGKQELKIKRFLD